MSSIQQDRQTRSYRILEASIGIFSIGFMILLVVLSIAAPAVVSIFLIVYSFMWILKYSLNVMYTFISYKELRRWESVNWNALLTLIGQDFDTARSYLVELKQRFRSKIGWDSKLTSHIQTLESNRDSKYANPFNVTHICIFSLYNENPSILIRSLEYIYKSGYPLQSVIVVVSQEARVGEAISQSTYTALQNTAWINAIYSPISDPDIVFQHSDKDSTYKDSKLFSFLQSNKQLNVVFTTHPDGLVGEIKGKASNEDWGARQATLLIKSKQIDPELCIVTSLDADSHVGKDFFHTLSYTFCCEPNRLQRGYQPIHIYSNNFFQTTLWPRQVAAQTALSNLTNLGIDGETPFFAIYSIPLPVLMDIDYWARDVIAEDSVLFIKCLTHYKGDFSVIPSFGVFEGDAVEGDHYIEGVSSQYKQLQRWAWGGVEGFPYMYKRFFLDHTGRLIDLRVRLKWTYLLFSNHFFWSSSPIIFVFIIYFPQLFGGEQFRQTPVSQNLNTFAISFSVISYIFVIAFGYVSFYLLARKSSNKENVTITQKITLLVQIFLSPFLYALMGLPALDAQIRGIRGKYLGYWVTPKK